MKIVTTTHEPYVFISVPVEVLVGAGIAPDDIIEIYAEDGKIIIRHIEIEDEFDCDEDCINCPFHLLDCERHDNRSKAEEAER